MVAELVNEVRKLQIQAQINPYSPLYQLQLEALLSDILAYLSTLPTSESLLEKFYEIESSNLDNFHKLSELDILLQPLPSKSESNRPSQPLAVQQAIALSGISIDTDAIISSKINAGDSKKTEFIERDVSGLAFSLQKKLDELEIILEEDNVAESNWLSSRRLKKLLRRFVEDINAGQFIDANDNLEKLEQIAKQEATSSAQMAVIRLLGQILHIGKRLIKL